MKHQTPIPELLAALLSSPPEERVSQFPQQEDRNAVLLALADEAQRLTFVDAARAVAASEVVAELAERLGDARSRARAQRARSQALAYGGRFEDALAACSAACEIATASGDAVEAARARLASMHPLGEMGRYAEAIAAGESARDELLAAGAATLAARADLNLGGVHQNRGDPQRALVHLDRAAAALVGEPLALGHVQNNRGEALLLLNEFERARVAFEAAQAAYETAHAHLAAAIALGNQADLAARRGMLSRAMHLFEQARRRLETDDAATHRARLLAEQAEALAALGLSHDALVTYEQVAPELDRLGLAWEAARARAGMGRCLLRAGRLNDARSALEDSAARFDELNNKTDRARVELLLALVALSESHTASAADMLRRAAVDLPPRPLDVGMLGYLRGRLALANGDAAAARDTLTQAIEPVARVGIAPLLADLLHVRAAAAEGVGQLGAAIDDLRAAIVQIERVRGTLQADRFRAAFLGRRQGVYEDLARLLLDRGAPADLAEAFQTIERAKSRALLDLARGAVDDESPDEVDSADRELAGESARLRSELNGLYARLLDQRGAAEQSAVDWTAAVADREARLTALETRLASARGPASLLAAPIALADVQSRLEADEALIEYSILGEELAAIVVSGGRATAIRRLAPLRDVVERVRRLQFQLARAMRPGADDPVRRQRLCEDANAELGGLHAALLAPLRPLIENASRLIVAPHGPLHGVPMHALWNGSEHALDRWEFTYAPSASVWAQMGGAAAPAPARGALVVGVADALAPRIEDEARVIARLLGVDPVLGRDASVERVSAAMREVATVHLACHGEFSLEMPYASGLRLGDRLLTVRDIYHLRLAARLIVLSGCSTGRSLVQAGDELLGLLRAFIAAGASALLVSLWPVSDQATIELMCDFHKMGPAGSAPSERMSARLRAAQLRCREANAHPVYWAPFVMVGRS